MTAQEKIYERDSINLCLAESMLQAQSPEMSDLYKKRKAVCSELIDAGKSAAEIIDEIYKVKH